MSIKEWYTVITDCGALSDELKRLSTLANQKQIETIEAN